MGKGRSAAMQRLKAVENGISGLRKACRMPNRRRVTGLAVCKKAELHTERRFRVLRCVKKRGIAHGAAVLSLAVCKKAELHTTVPAFPPALIQHDPLRHRECSTTSSSMTHNDIANDTPIIQHITPRYLGRSTKSSSTPHHVIMNCGAIGETVLLWLQLSQRIHP